MKGGNMTDLKITIGFVIQSYNTRGECFKQEFIAGDEVSWEDEDGNPIDPLPNARYQPFDMVQPEEAKRSATTKWKCPRCDTISFVDVSELPIVGTPHCPECDDGVEMEFVE
jgi:hypothetical protein